MNSFEGEILGVIGTLPKVYVYFIHDTFFLKFKNARYSICAPLMEHQYFYWRETYYTDGQIEYYKPLNQRSCTCRTPCGLLKFRLEPTFIHCERQPISVSITRLIVS
jgi:hypothetical protein